MPFQVSPGVNVSEIDLTTVVPAVSTTEGALGGVFRWGPVGQRVLIDSEQNLAATFGKPTNHNGETFFTAASFLSYGNKLYVTRAANTTGTANATTISGTNNDANLTLTANLTSLGLGAGDTMIYNGVKYVVASVQAGANITITGVSNTAAVFTSSADVTFADSNAAFSAVVNTAVLANSTLSSFSFKNEDVFEATNTAGLNGYSIVTAAARYPGDLGNSLKISVCDSANAYSRNLQIYTANSIGSPDGDTTGTITATIGSANLTFTVVVDGGTITTANTQATTVAGLITVGDYIEVGNTTIGKQKMKVVSVGNVVTQNATGGTTSNTRAVFTVVTDSKYALSTNFSSSNTVTRYWEYHNLVDTAPGVSDYQSNFGGNTSAVDEVHAVVVDEDGKFSGVPGTVLEVFAGLSRATDAKTEDGGANYYKTVINATSKYVYIISDRSGAASNTSAYVATASTNTPLSKSFGFGQDGDAEDTVSVAELTKAYDLYASAEDVDVSLLLAGKARSATAETISAPSTASQVQLANYLIDNIAEVRKDCVVFVSPNKFAVVNDPGDETTNITTFRDALRSTSYGMLDSGYKYMYDKYNDVYRWVPLNGDIAGLCVRTDDLRDPWWSPAGFNRGQVKNIVKLAFNPSKAARDVLYKAGVNPVVTFPGQGTILYGDKTLLAKPSAFDRINVRRLFIVLEKAIATASKFTMFEFNDDFTRAQFRNLVEPFLRDVQGRRGIYDFKVVCDTTNNTGEVIDRNEFIGDIYIKPAKSINFIQLNFVAVRTGVEFSEIVGQF